MPSSRTLLPRFFHLHEIEIYPSRTDSDESSLDAATEGLSLNDESNTEPPKGPRISTEEMREDLYASPESRRKMYISACVRRDIGELQELFDKYSDDFIAQTSRDGDTGILLAATEEGGLETLKWLQSKGAALDQASHYDRTPLMEAALWGRLDTVRYLTTQGVNVEARDGNGMQALELAKDLPRNTDERCERTGNFYREPGDAATQRRRIEAHLKNLSTRSSQIGDSTSSSSQRVSFFQRNADGHLELYRPQSLLEKPIGQQQKAFATLDRGDNYPLVNAMSGYPYVSWPNMIDNALWTDRADDLRKFVGLPRNRQMASHVEPQLLAYLVWHHLLHMLEYDAERLQNLAGAKPTYALTPVITVSKLAMCYECGQFFEAFKRRFVNEAVRFHCVGEQAIAINVIQ